MCTALSRVVLTDGLEMISNNMFSGASSLNDITIVSTITSFGYGIFQGCISLTTIGLAVGLTSITSDYFSGASSYLQSISIPSTVLSIGLTNVLYQIYIFIIKGYVSFLMRLISSITIPSSVVLIGLTNIIYNKRVNYITNISFYRYVCVRALLCSLCSSFDKWIEDTFKLYVSLCLFVKRSNNCINNH